jgi:hypothetical protein
MEELEEKINFVMKKLMIKNVIGFGVGDGGKVM